MINILVFSWTVFNFALIWLNIHSIKKKDWRDTFISSSLCFGVSIWLLAEILSFFNILNESGILYGSICCTIICFLITLHRYRKKKIIFTKAPISSLKDKYLIFIFFALIVTFFTAIAYPPNNWDSMTYHLPRIEHWLQNGNLNHYFSHIDRQLFSAPFSEIAIMYGRALSGDDWLMNLVQWFSFLGSIIVISKISFQLGLGKKQQLAAALLFATLPMAILQASSTQNDLVVTFWLVCTFERFLQWRKTNFFCYSLEFGLALGLAILTKGTAYIIALPIVIFYAIICLKDYRKYLLIAICTGLLSLVLNLPHYMRNYMTFKNPIEAKDTTISDFTLKSFFVTTVSNIYVNIPIPTSKSIGINYHLKQLDKSIYPYAPLYVYSEWENSLRSILIFHEDSAKNTIHMLAVILSLLLLFSKYIRDKKNSAYLWIIIACWCSFSLCIPWQPWVTRLQVPLFAISIPLVVLAFSIIKKKFLLNSLLIAACIVSLFPLFANFSRPLIILRSTPFLGRQTSTQSIWNSSRDKLFFTNRMLQYSKYTEACNVILKNGNSAKVGLLLGGDSWEYPIWRYCRKSNINLLEIKHQEISSIDNQINFIFSIGNGNIKKICPQITYNDENTPFVLYRDLNNSYEWELIYPL